jgi:transposase
MAAIEVAILEQIPANPDLAQRFEILTSIPGVSAVTAFALLIEMPELGTLEAGRAASLAGLAPVARHSGRWSGRAPYGEAEPQSAKPFIFQPSSRPASIRT